MERITQTRVPTNGNGTNGAGSQAGTDDDRSLGEVVSDLLQHSQELIKGEIALVRDEASRNAKWAAKAAALGAGAAVFAVVSLILLGHLLAQGLDSFMDEWIAYAIVTVLFGAVAAGLGMAAKKIVQEHPVAPTDSIQHAKEDARWLKTQI